jgi:hypothetical protein
MADDEMPETGILRPETGDLTINLRGTLPGNPFAFWSQRVDVRVPKPSYLNELELIDQPMGLYLGTLAFSDPRRDVGEDQAPALDPYTSDRGLRAFEAIECRNEARVFIHEASVATEPCIWLAVGGAACLTLAQARLIARELVWLADNHYHHQEVPS